jgi:2-polyprenyl-3-methyl-5-hydroxy-6-metoxy-1,4-benzoquinol methylase
MCPAAARRCPLCDGENLAVVFTCRDRLVSGEEFRILHCARCDLRMTDPLPSQEVIGRYYDSEDYLGLTRTRTGAMNRVYHLARRITARWRAQIASASAPVRPGRILDVGCGTGELLAHMHRRGWTVCGVEPLTRARLAAQRTPGVEVLDVPAFLALRGRRFDVVTLWHALEHVHDVDGYLAHIGDLLVAGGALVIACPNYASFDAEYYGASWYAYDPPRHLWHYRPETMTRQLAKHGFAVRAMRALSLDPFYIALLTERHAPRGVPVLHPLLVGCRAMLAGAADVTRASAIVYVAYRASDGPPPAPVGHSASRSRFAMLLRCMFDDPPTIGMHTTSRT